MSAGAPQFYATPEELSVKVEEYFNTNSFYTITGLALYLGFCSRQSVYDYEKRPEFSYIIKRALLRVENAYELKLSGDKPTGAIFVLKNMGWIDKQQTDVTTNGKDINSLPIIINSKGEEPITE